MRTLHELYLILWDEIKDLDCIMSLCWKIGYLDIDNKMTFEEKEKLKKHFQSQKPSEKINSEFLNSETWRGSLWWWSENEDSNPINRKAFIQKMIEITKPKSNENI